ncbi:MAG: Lrp/AsnC family transcriptional regulator [Acidobacteria bacterium]|nr:Lrp/AsnC family transcriptional regulator [Acidobacteriota bacterium]
MKQMLNELSEFDSKLLTLLSANARMSWAELAVELGVSAPAVTAHVRALEERGILRGYTVLVDAESVGLGMTAFVFVTLGHPRHRAGFLKRVTEWPEVLECHHVAGDDDYLLKVMTGTPRDLDTFLSEKLKGLPGMVRTRTTVALGTVKSTPVLPLFA